MSRTINRAVVLASCLAFMVGACSKQVDSTSVEKDVVRVVKAKLPSVSDISADCPGDVTAKKGKTFDCKLDLGVKTTEVKINITDVKDKQFFFKVGYSQAIIAADAYAKALAQRAGTGSKAQCGKENVLLKKKGDIVNCTVTTKGQTTRLKLRVRDTDGNLDPVTR